MTRDWMNTLGAALRLQPETRRVVVVGGSSAMDKRYLASARAVFASAPARLEFTYLTDLPLSAAAAKLAALPDGTIVFLISFLLDGAGRNLTSRDALEIFAEQTRAPIYGVNGALMGHGIVGGRLIDFETHGAMAGELGLRLLRGEKLGPADIVTRDTNTYAFDWRQLRRWGLKENRLPPGSVTHFREPSATLAHVQRVRAVSELAATLAHEINQPLGAIVSNAEAACRLVDPADPNRTELLETLDDIINDGQRASEVIRRLRAMLRTGVTEQNPCDVNGLIVEVLGLLQADLVRVGVSTELRLREGLPLVRGDAIQLQQVILNLALNAEAAMAAGEPRRLTIETAEATPGTVDVCIRDTGVGVKEGDLEHIFEPFVTTKASGLGMGLSISRSIVEAHGGTIRAERNPDRGLSVHVELPSGGGP